MPQGISKSYPGTRLYTTGPALQTLARKLSQQGQHLELALLPMQAVSNKFEVTLSLWQRTSRYSMTMLVATENRAAMQILIRVGGKLPLMHGSIGRLMALRSDLTEAERREVFNVVSADRPISYQTFMRQAHTALKKGWSIDDGHVRAVATTVSVPVETGAPPLAYICTATTFRNQYRDEALDAFVTELQAVGQRLSLACSSK